MISIPTSDDYHRLFNELRQLQDRVHKLELRPNPLRWLSVSAAAEALGMSEPHIRRLVKENRLESTKQGRKVLIDMESVVKKAQLGKGKHLSGLESDQMKVSKLKLKASLAKTDLIKKKAASSTTPKTKK